MDDTRLGGRVPAVLRIRLKYADVDTFIEKFSVNLSRGGLFIASKTPQPVGTTLKFEFQLSQGTPVVRGEGEVIWVKQFDAAAPTKPHGMGVRFLRLDAESKVVIDRALAWKEKTKAAAAAIDAKARTMTPVPPSAPPPRIDTEVRMMSAMNALSKKNGAADEEAPAPLAAGPAPVAPPPIPVADRAPRAAIKSDQIVASIAAPAVAPSSSNGNGAHGDLDALAAEWGLTQERIAATVDRVRAERVATDGETLDRLTRSE